MKKHLPQLLANKQMEQTGLQQTESIEKEGKGEIGHLGRGELRREEKRMGQMKMTVEGESRKQLRRIRREKGARERKNGRRKGNDEKKRKEQKMKVLPLPSSPFFFCILKFTQKDQKMQHKIGRKRRKKGRKCSQEKNLTRKRQKTRNSADRRT